MMSAKGQQHGPNDGHNHGSGGTERPWELYFAIASGVTYIAGTVAELMARDRLLESGVEAFEASFDTHRRTLRLGLSVPREHEPESCT